MLVIVALALGCFVLGVACIMLAWAVRELHSDLNMFTRPLAHAMKWSGEDERLPPGQPG